MRNNMMKKAKTILSFLIFASCDNASRQAGSIHGLMGHREKIVYICTGPMSQCYYSDRDCYGLQRCSKNVEVVSLKEAIEAGRRPCKYCH